MRRSSVMMALVNRRESAQPYRLGDQGKNERVRAMYSAYSGDRFFIARSSSATPDTLIRKKDMMAGLMTVHHVAE